MTIINIPSGINIAYFKSPVHATGGSDQPAEYPVDIGCDNFLRYRSDRIPFFYLMADRISGIKFAVAGSSQDPFFAVTANGTGNSGVRLGSTGSDNLP